MLNKVTFSGGRERRSFRIARTIESRSQKCELAAKVRCQSAIPMPRSKNRCMIQAVFGTKMHAASRRRGIDAPAQRQCNSARRIVQDFLQSYSNGADNFDDATLTLDGARPVPIAAARYRQRFEGRRGKWLPSAKSDRCHERREDFINRAVQSKVEFLLSGQSLIAVCRYDSNDRLAVVVDEQQYLFALPTLSRSHSRSPQAASIIARLGLKNA